MLVVRRRAPEGGYYNDSDRALRRLRCAGHGVLRAARLPDLPAFESYDASRSGAETEALTVAQQIQTAQRLSGEVGDELTGQLVCYARWVIDDEWDRMEPVRSARTSTRGARPCS